MSFAMSDPAFRFGSALSCRLKWKSPRIGFQGFNVTGLCNPGNAGATVWGGAMSRHHGGCCGSRLHPQSAE
ncbi:hypothetical protein DPEC_G00358210 [Dallia pectoralis]|uniref:Uncharacterized protein n=1 Tax=Dallia pectoralis TaxID=75939 RepID=A0ACC2F0F6_DALPE|nr:hypothetical protein DPEC_G00358210 [Dallia pectoralis]